MYNTHPTFRRRKFRGQGGRKCTGPFTGIIGSTWSFFFLIFFASICFCFTLTSNVYNNIRPRSYISLSTMIFRFHCLCPFVRYEKMLLFFFWRLIVEKNCRSLRDKKKLSHLSLYSYSLSFARARNLSLPLLLSYFSFVITSTVSRTLTSVMFFLSILFNESFMYKNLRST